MENKNFLKTLLIAQTSLLLIYTFLAFKNEGANLFGVFLDNIQALNWNGQFNLDFACYLTLSGLWIMWRNKFSVSSIVFGLVAMILGIIVFAPYILSLLIREKGNLKSVLIGAR